MTEHQQYPSGQPQDGPPQQPQSTPPPPQWSAPATPAAYPGAAPLSPTEERQWAMLSHVIPLVAFVLSAGTLGFVASIVIYALYKDRGPFVRAHAANSLNLQITVGIALLVSLPLMLLLVGFLTYAAACVFIVVIHIIAAVKANSGEWYQPPMTIRFVS